MTANIKSAAAAAENKAAMRLNELLSEAARGTTMERGASRDFEELACSILSLIGDGSACAMATSGSLVATHADS
ncbi:hypothetical protein [Rhizobium leguminosarum]|uniref:hypothetical protein n=1 Tax=Rhizobium leguminosarum TaxID=384 RepID=UPI00103DEB4B|nr:hypothetical protein [Rhizobium leguminosarum]TBZ80581.1 hypothetical protein E0H53_29655 [Rhizobium leguminosarum bv. viciae]TBZ99510.1 hypothetical protein E0H63_25350 [Rhizobium leguminosarum bv. viciae]